MISEVTNDSPYEEYHAATKDNLDSKIDSWNKETQAKERQVRQNEKIKQQLRFFENVTLADVTIDQNNLILLSANSISRTMVQGIKNIEPSKIGSKVLRQICRILKLNNYNGKSKLVMLQMIGERKKNEHLESKMYSGDFEETTSIEGGVKKSKQKKEQGQQRYRKTVPSIAWSLPSFFKNIDLWLRSSEPIHPHPNSEVTNSFMQGFIGFCLHLTTTRMNQISLR